MNKEQEDLLLILKCALWQDVRYASGIDKPCWNKIYKYCCPVKLFQTK